MALACQEEELVHGEASVGPFMDKDLPKKDTFDYCELHAFDPNRGIRFSTYARYGFVHK